MKAVLYTKPGRLEYVDVPDPSAPDREVLIDVAAAGICGSELEGFASRSPFRKPPLVMGHEFVGRRRDTGQLVAVNPLLSCGRCRRCLAGRQNICSERAIIGIHRDGGFAEQASVPEESCYSLPEGADLIKASAVEPLANAIHAVRTLQQIDLGAERIGIIGAGMIGLTIAHEVLRRGMRDVHVIDLVPARLEHARSLGVRSCADALTGTFDAIFDVVGSPATRAMAADHLEPGGTCVWIGLHAEEAGFDGLDLVRNEKQVVGSFCYTPSDFQRAVDNVSELPSDWFHPVPLAEGVPAFLSLLDTTPAHIKTVLVTDGHPG